MIVKIGDDIGMTVALLFLVTYEMIGRLSMIGWKAVKRNDM